jgi:heat shock protein HslJ
MSELEGPLWRLDSLATAGAGLVPVPEGVEATLALADGIASGSGGINRFTGPFVAADDGSLSLGPLATTLMAGIGPAADTEPLYLAALADTATGEAADGRLLLRDATGEVLAVLVADEG